MEVPSSIKFLPNIYAGDEDYEEGFDDSLVMNKDVGIALNVHFALVFYEILWFSKNAHMDSPRYASQLK